MRRWISLCLPVLIAVLSMDAHSESPRVTQATCVRQSQTTCLEWKASVQGYGTAQRMFHETEWLRWGADIWKRNIEYCDVSNPTKVNSDLYAFCSRVVTVHDTCQQPGVSGQHKAFCDNAGLSPSKASRYIKVVADNWDGIKSCSSVYNVFKEGFALPAGGVPPWPKKPDRDKARPMNVKESLQKSSVLLCHALSR